MATPAGNFPTTDNRSINLRLWVGILLPPVAGGLNTMVGYMVSNYDCNVHNRHLVLLTNILSALLCVAAGIVTTSMRHSIEDSSDDASEALLHSRRFMMNLGLCFAVGFLLFISAGTASTFLLRPCDL